MGILLVIAWITSYIHETVQRTAQESAGKHELHRVLVEAANDFEAIIFDLDLLTESKHLTSFLESGSLEAKEGFTHQMRFVAKGRRFYDQIRFIDSRGMEIIRINSDKLGQTTNTPSSQLQNKINRDYFKDAFKLSPGQFHISRFDLNIEHEQLEIPHKPMIRFSAPIFDKAGKKQGVIVLNHLGEVVLNSIQKVFNKSKNQVYVVDQEGYFLLTPHYGEAWGFMLNHTNTFGSRFPNTWDLLKNQQSGAFQTDDGHFIFENLTISLRDDLRSRLERNNQEWKVLIQISTPGWNLQDLKNNPVEAIILLCGIIISFMITWIVTLFMVSHRLAEQAKTEALRELEFQKRHWTNMPLCPQQT